MCVIGKERKGESAVVDSDNENPDSEPVVPAEGNGDVEQKHAFAH